MRFLAPELFVPIFCFTLIRRIDYNSRDMSAHFHVDLGPFIIDVQLDDSGVHLQRGPLSQVIAWQQISGATLITSTQFDGLHEKDEEQRAAQYLGQDAFRTIQSLRGKVAQIAIAYRDQKNDLRQTEIPAPLTDQAFLREFQTRLGSRWLGESTNHEHAAKRLHTNPGFFKSIFALLAIIALVAIVFLLGFMGPLLSFLSIQKMLVDLQDGNYASFTSRLITYVALFVIAYFIHRVIRVKLDSLKSRRVARPITKL
jgi:hypothetical protein